MNLFRTLFLCLLVSLVAFINVSESYAQCSAKFTASTEGGKTNETVTVKITVENFTDIGGVQWTMRWDPAVLEYVSLQDFDLPELTQSAFNVTKVAQGYITTSWYNQQGVTKSNGTVIFTIKFKLVGADGKSSNIDFSNSPLQIEISDKNAQKCTNAVLTGGKVNIGTVIQPPVGLTMKVGSGAVDKDQEICVPVTVTGFKSITAMQFSLGWDTSKIKFTKLQNFKGLTSFDAGNFGSSLAPLGKMTCVWIDQNTTGQTVADGQAIFEICYKYTGACPGSASINITDDPTKVLFNSSTGALTATKESGTLTASCSSQLGVTVSKITHPCPGQTNGAIEITTTGGTGTLTYAWTNSTIAKNPANLAAGSYNVTVTDGGGKTATLGSPVVLSALAATSQGTDPTAGQSNGAIVLTVTGGNPTLTYLWSNNATTKDINNLAAGSYTYTITDGNNCKLTGSVTIGSVALDITNITPVSPPCAGLAGGSINISAVGGTAPYTFAWTGPGGFAATSKDITGLKAGTYKVTVKDAVNATKTSADIILTESGTALTISARVKQPTKAGSDGEISITPAGGTPPISYQWNDGSTSGSRTFLNSGTYSVVARDSKGCSVSQSFNLQPTDGICYTSARVFTPNGDGFNELFVINCAGNISNQLLIYNRWNQLVYSTNNYQNDWNGVDKNGFLLPDGTYYWILKDTSGQSNSLYKGYVTLIRTLN